jgi:hypothetical protein
VEPVNAYQLNVMTVEALHVQVMVVKAVIVILKSLLNLLINLEKLNIMHRLIGIRMFLYANNN